MPAAHETHWKLVLINGLESVSEVCLRVSEMLVLSETKNAYVWVTVR